MKLKQVLLFMLCIAVFSCSTESINSPNEEEETEDTTNNPKRVKEAVGFQDGIEVAKEVYTYLNNKLLNIKVYSKLGNNWIETVNFDFSYDGNKITQSYDTGRVEFLVDTNNQLSSINYLENDDPDLDTGYLLSYSNNKLNNYTYFEGTFTDGSWKYKSNLIYENENKVLELNNQWSTPTEPNFVPESQTTFQFSTDIISGWITDYSIAAPEDRGYNEKIEYTYLNDYVSKTTEHSWDTDNSTWEKVAELNYTYDENGYLLTQKYTETGNSYTENHLYDYFYFGDDSQDFNEVKYTYEEGDSNNYILLYPEFIAHKTPNPYFNFYN